MYIGFRVGRLCRLWEVMEGYGRLEKVVTVLMHPQLKQVLRLVGFVG